jgi:hypothetical protein
MDDGKLKDPLDAANYFNNVFIKITNKHSTNRERNAISNLEDSFR